MEKGLQRLPVSWLSRTHKEPLSARDPSEAATDLAASFLLPGNTVWGCSQHKEGGTKTPWVSWGHHWALLYRPWSPPHHTPRNFPLLFKPVCEGVFCYLLAKISWHSFSASPCEYTLGNQWFRKFLVLLILKIFNLLKTHPKTSTGLVKMQLVCW